LSSSLAATRLCLCFADFWEVNHTPSSGRRRTRQEEHEECDGSHVSTHKVESVPALQQHADLVTVGKLRQADRKLRPLAPITFTCALNFGSEFTTFFFTPLFVGVGRDSPSSAKVGGWRSQAEPAMVTRPTTPPDHHEVELDGGGLWGHRLGLEESEPRVISWLAV